MSEPPRESQLQRAVAFIMKGAFVVQCLTAAVLLFVPFGFDKPSVLGLDFGHFMIVLILYCAAFMTGVAIAAGRRHFRFVLLQVAILVGGITLIFSGLAPNS